MGKVSSNAGKHPYLRTNEEEYKNLFAHIKRTQGGVPISSLKTPFVKVNIQTEYSDKNNEIIHFKDTLKFKGREYVVDYRDQKWVIIDILNPKNIEILSEKAPSTVLSKKYN